MYSYKLVDLHIYIYIYIYTYPENIQGESLV